MEVLSSDHCSGTKPGCSPGILLCAPPAIEYTTKEDPLLARLYLYRAGADPPPPPRGGWAGPNGGSVAPAGLPMMIPIAHFPSGERPPALPSPSAIGGLPSILRIA